MTDDSAPASTPAEPELPQVPAPPIVLDTRLADGEWHRLHPATPVLRGGIVLIAIIGYAASQVREQLVDLFIGGRHSRGDDDPVTSFATHGGLLIILLIILAGLLLIIGIFYLSWRVHSFRITDEVVEVRSGLIRRTSRKGRLDRIQGINIVRPFFARLFGAARLEIDVAGHDANVRLDYLSSSNADALRRDILRLASGTREAEAAAAAKDQRGFVEQRLSEFTAPEFDSNAAPPESVVKVHIGRLVGSILLHDSTVFFVVVVVVFFVILPLPAKIALAFPVVAAVFGYGNFAIRRFAKSARYSIASTPDGVRVGFGLLTLSNETLPPGRIHSVQVRQPLLWRFPGWWEVKVNRASKSNAKGADGQRNTTILPVGNLDEVLRVLGLLLPTLGEPESVDVLRLGIASSGAAGGFVNSPRRAAVVRWFSWRRNGYARLPGTILLRTGAIWRRLTIVPEPRVQSIGLYQGPLYRALGIAHLDVHTVSGPIRADLGAVDREIALAFFEDVALSVDAEIGADVTHRWRSGEAGA